MTDLLTTWLNILWTRQSATKRRDQLQTTDRDRPRVRRAVGCDSEKWNRSHPGCRCPWPSLKTGWPCCQRRQTRQMHDWLQCAPNPWSVWHWLVVEAFWKTSHCYVYKENERAIHHKHRIARIIYQHHFNGTSHKPRKMPKQSDVASDMAQASSVHESSLNNLYLLLYW